MLKNRKLSFLAYALLFLAIGAGLLWPQKASANTGIPFLVSFEGKVVKSDGTNIPDGTYNMEFKIYSGTSNTGVGDTLLFTEDWLVGSAQGGVAFTSGTYAKNIGSAGVGTGDSVALSSLNFNQYPLWLSVQIGNTSSCTITTTFQSNCGGDGEMTPFIQFTSAPYSLNSNEVGGLTASQLGQLATNQTWTGTNAFQPAANTAALQVKNASNPVFTVDTSGNNVIIGNPGSQTATLQFANGTGANVVGIQAGASTAAYTLTLPTTAPGTNQCLVSGAVTATLLSFGSCATGVTLQSAYTGSTGGTTPEIVEDSTRTTVDIQGYSGQSADLLDLRAYASSGLGAVEFGVSPSGNVTAAGTIAASGQTISVNNSTNPDFSLNTGSSTAEFAIASAAGNYSNFATANDAVLRSDTGNLILTARSASGNVYLGTGSADTAKLTVLSGGNVGVGTTAPSYNLDIQGSTGQRIQTTTNSTSAFQVQNSAGTSLLTVDTTNQQVIVRSGSSDASEGSNLFSGFPTRTGWTNSGSGSLMSSRHISGTTPLITIFTPTIGTTYEVSYTYSGCSSTNTLGVTMGGYTLENPTSCVGSDNVVVTPNSTAALSFTPSNTYVGTVSGVAIYAITQNNSALTVQNSTGAATLQIRSSSDNSNLFIGMNSGQNNTSGSTYNTALGSFSLQNNTGGYDNTASGSTALQYNTTGNDNTANGDAALYANTTGYDNTATGSNALGNNIIGYGNTANGYYSLLGNTTGNLNTAYGFQSGYLNSTGSNNSYFGNQAGDYDSGGHFSTTATLQNATAIGAYAQVQASNSLVLGSVDTATNVGIGTTVPLNTFSVSPVDLNSSTITASQTSGSGTITASAAIFSSGNVGEEFIWADGTQETITGYTSSTVVTGSSTTITESGQYFRTHHIGLQVQNNGDTYIQGANSTTAFNIESAGGTDIVNVDTANGRLGVNTATPQASLDVVQNNTDDAVHVTVAAGSSGSSGSVSLGSTTTAPSGVIMNNGTAALDSGHVVHLLNNFAYIALVNGTSISYGASATLGFSAGSAVAVAALSSTSFVVVGYTNTLGAVGAQVCSVSGGSTISCGSVNNSASISSGSLSYGMAVTALSSSSIAVLVPRNTAAPGLIAATISGTTVTFGAASTLSGGSSDTAQVGVEITAINSTGVVMGYTYGNTVYAAAATISGTTISSLGTAVQLGTGSNGNTNTLGIAALSNSSFAVLVAGTLFSASYSGTTVSLAGSLSTATPPSGGNTAVSLSQLSTTAVIVNWSSYVGSTSQTSSSEVASWNGTAFSIGSSVSQSVGVASSANLAFSSTALSSTSFYVTVDNGSNYYAWVGTISSGSVGISTPGEALVVDSQGNTFLRVASGTSTSGFQVQDANGNALINVNSALDGVCIGGSTCAFNTSLHPNEKLGVLGSVIASGGVGTGTPDIAEYIDTAPNVTAYDVVMADPNNAESVVKATAANAGAVVGAISDGSSGFMMENAHYGQAFNAATSAPDPNAKPMTLAGRIPVHVTDENGPISPGDYLTVSATLPGYAMKATKAGPTIGKALGYFDGSTGSSGTVLTLINLSYYDPSNGQNMQATNGSFESLQTSSLMSDSIQATNGQFVSLSVSGNLTVTGDIAVGGDLSVTGKTTVADITINGHIVTGGNAPQIQISAAAGQGATVTVQGNDTSGTITITTGAAAQPAKNGQPAITAPASGNQVAISFSQPYGATPHIIISPNDSKSSAMQPYPDQQSANGFSLGVNQTPAANTTYTFTYFIVQ